MAKAKAPKTSQPSEEKKGITQITVSGYKSIGQEQQIEIRPLTILAGPNSSGKSSFMQPLLLLKQTLEASYDPGALLLDGPNVRFTSADQLFSHFSKGQCADTFCVGLTVDDDPVTTCFSKVRNKGLDVLKMTYGRGENERTIHQDMSSDKIRSTVSPVLISFYSLLKLKPTWVIVRDRCFLEVAVKDAEDSDGATTKAGTAPGDDIAPYIRGLIHLPGLRGNPARTYPVTAVAPNFPGTFEKYAASVILQWQADKNESKLRNLGEDLNKLGLTWKVTARRITDTQVELQVGRLPHAAKGGARDLVSIADVGIGVSQTLPVIVSLHVAKSEQLVYLEQPEIHLHPRAQFVMAQILADAANRGVRVVVETHSSLLLLGIQTMVAEGKLPPEKVKLHWFHRSVDGSTEINSTDLDEAGAFGEWPEDFAEVSLEAESRYLDAAEQR